MAAKNHPQIGDKIKVEPIKSEKDIRNIKNFLSNKPRDLAIFILGINTNLRASDLLKITIGQVRHLQPGDHFTIKEQKTGKDRCITINKTVHDAIQALLQNVPDAKRSAAFPVQERQPAPMCPLLELHGKILV
jgi:integrase